MRVVVGAPGAQLSWCACAAAVRRRTPSARTAHHARQGTEHVSGSSKKHVGQHGTQSTRGSWDCVVVPSRPDSRVHYIVWVYACSRSWQYCKVVHVFEEGLQEGGMLL